MRKSTLNRIVLFFSVVITSITACKKDSPASLTPPPLPDQSFVEEFDTVAAAFRRGWVPINNSNPKGTGIWNQAGGPQPLFKAWSSKGTYVGFIASDISATSADAAVISNWLISPPVWMKNGDKIIFYSRASLFDSGDPVLLDWGNNLEICVNRVNDGTGVGVAIDPRNEFYNYDSDHGDFSVVHSINPPTYNKGVDWFDYHTASSDPAAYDPLAYPVNWTKYEVTLNGFNKPHKGRFAFRYYTLDGGSNGNGSAVGIDSVAFVSKP